VTFKSRDVTVKGPRGTLNRSFKHIALDIQSVDEGKKIKVDLWFGNRETIAAIRYDQNFVLATRISPLLRT
jgi:large subunit ribosomal protein L9e